MRLRSVPRVSTTKPETSASAAPAVVTVTGSALGTVTAGGAAIVAPVTAVCGSTVTAHSPAPPPASVRSPPA